MDVFEVDLDFLCDQPRLESKLTRLSPTDFFFWLWKDPFLFVTNSTNPSIPTTELELRWQR